MKRLILRLLIGFLSLGILGGFLGIGILVYFSLDLPKISTLNDYHPPIPSKILAKDGTILALQGKQKRELITLEEIPEKIINAFLAAEDSSFYEHDGVDYMGIFRAMLANIRAGKFIQGGSTITQQVAKSLLLSRERSLSRKIKDFLLARRIEKHFSKKEILYLYLNQVYLGGGYYGVKSAFDGYFGKSLAEATIAEAAMVAGLLVAPGRYSPYVNPKRAKMRQGYVLTRMKDTGKITEEEYNAAVAESTKFQLRKEHLFKAGYFTDWVRQRVIRLVGGEEFLTGGYTVQTTLDYELQQYAEAAVQETVREVDKRQGYKGPIGKLGALASDQWNIEFIKEFLRDQSTYFTINSEREKVYEFEFVEEDYKRLQEYKSELKEIAKSKVMSAGNLEDYSFLKHIKVGEKYKAQVVGVNDQAQIIFAEIGGIVGIIPYDFFKWAHERAISEDRNFFPYVTKPSSILKNGDIILIKVLKESVAFFDQAKKGYSRLLKKQNQKLLNEVFDQKYFLFSLEQEPEVEGALVSLDPFTGEVISFVGGYDFNRSEFNRAIQSQRQPGSAFKPLLFACALENGYTPASIIIDSPETLGGTDDSLNWKPRNYDGRFKGPVTLRSSLEQSRNVPTVKIALDLGVQKILDFNKRIGLNAKLDEDLSLALGSFGVTLLDIVRTYSIFPNGGKKIAPKTIVKVIDRFGQEIPFDERYEDLKGNGEEAKVSPTPTTAMDLVDRQEIDLNSEAKKSSSSEDNSKARKNPFWADLNEEQVYDQKLAYIMTNLLRGVVLHGTGRAARGVSSFIGGKTGTTNNYVDAWFLGFSQKVATGVWTGFDENQTLGWGESGAKAALPAWIDYMKKAVEKLGDTDFRVPPGIVNVLINKETGRPTSFSDSGSFTETFVEGYEPGAKTEVENQDNPISGPILEEDDYYNNQ